MAAFAKKLAEANRIASHDFIAKENIHRLRHGRDWGFLHASPEAFDGGMKVHSTEISTSIEDIARHRVECLSLSLASAASEMESQFARNLYQTVNDACESTGNTVSATDNSSLAEAFYAAIEKVEFTADKSGQVHLPTMHAAPETARRMQADLEASSEEFRKKFEEMKERKIKEALEREDERKRRFVSYGTEE